MPANTAALFLRLRCIRILHTHAAVFPPAASPAVAPAHPAAPRTSPASPSATPTEIPALCAPTPLLRPTTPSLFHRAIRSPVAVVSIFFRPPHALHIHPAPASSTPPDSRLHAQNPT